MLTRIYGVTFPSQKELDEYLVLLEEAKKRDHRKLGKELGVFTFDEDVGMGLPLWLPKGTVIIEEIGKVLQKAQNWKQDISVLSLRILPKKIYTSPVVICHIMQG